MAAKKSILKIESGTSAAAVPSLSLLSALLPLNT